VKIFARHRLLIGLLFAALSPPAFAQLSCPAPQKPMLDVELLLGRGNASDARWRQFLTREVTPRFPEGLTVYDTTGQWRNAAGVIMRERSRVLRVLVADAAVQDRIAAVAEAYKKAFNQQSVGIVMRPACVSF
jgi:hypothetical protein